MVSFFNLDVPAPHWQVNNQPASILSLEPNKSIILALLGNIRGRVMNSYNSYFDFMGMMLILHILGIISQLSSKYLAKVHPMTPSKTQQDQAFLPMANSKKYLFKTIRCLIYYTVSFYLCQFMVEALNSSRLILVEAKYVREQPDVIIPQEDDFIPDHLPIITKTKGARSVITSMDGNKIFQIYPTLHNMSHGSLLIGMDISDPLAIKYYPECDFKLPFFDIAGALSSDSKTLFLVTWNALYVFQISHIRSAPKLVSQTKIPTPDDSWSKPSVALYEEKNMIIIGNRNLHIFNISDVKNPIHQSWHPLSELSLRATSLAILPDQKIVLVGAHDGLTAFDLSDLKNPILKTRILEDEFVFSISVTSLETTGFIGILKKNTTEAQAEGNQTSNASLSIYLVDLKNIESSLSESSFLSIDQLKTCDARMFDEKFGVLPNIKMNFDQKYLYWACSQDYGYVDIANKKVSKFLDRDAIGAIALVHESKILLKMNSNATYLLALYQNIQKDDHGSFIWKPNSISRLKLNSSEKVFTFKNNRMVYIFNSSSTLQIYNTSENRFSLISTIELEITKPLSIVPSKNGKRLYMKTDEKTIQIYDIPNLKFFQKLDFSTAISDDFLVTPDDKIIFTTQEVGQNTTIIFADISNSSSLLIWDLLIEGEKKSFPGSAKLNLSPGGDSLVVFGATELIVLDVTTTLINKSAQQKYLTCGSNLESAIFSPAPSRPAIFLIEKDKILNQKTLRVFFPVPNSVYSSSSLPNLAGKLPMEASSNAEFLYVATSEHLLEINIQDYTSPKVSRLMKLSLKQFSLTGDDRFMYAVIGDYLEILDMRSKYALTSFKEDFSLGASNKVELQLLSRNSQDKYDLIFKNHKFLTANFYKASDSNSENELVISYSTLPNWINFDKDTAEITIESRLPSHLGTYKMHTTGSFQLPPYSKLKSLFLFTGELEESDQFLSGLTDHGYLDEEGFLTTKFNAYKKLTLNPQYSQYESVIRYFLKNYLTDQEFEFKVSPSLFLHQYPSLLEVETQSPHYISARVVLKPLNGSEIMASQIVKRTYSSSRSILNQNQTELTLDGTFLNINDALAEIIIDVKEPCMEENISIMISDNLNFPIETEISVSKSPFRINAKPIANSDQNLSIQSQVNKYSFASGQSFSINLHPKSYLDINERPLEYSSLSPELDWLEIRGLILTGTPPQKLWPSKVNVTMKIANEFKSEKVTFTLEIGMSAIILMQYAILYFSYIFSVYKMYQNFPKFWNILAQKSYRYPKAFQIAINQEVTDATIAPIGFFGKEFENADLLMNHLKKYLSKNPKDFIGHFKDEQAHGFDKNKLIVTINQVLETLTFEERYSVKYYMQTDDNQRERVRQIILDKIILAQLSLSSEKQTLNIFKKIKGQWIDIVEQEDPSQPFFKVDKLKLNYALQNLDSKVKRQKSPEAKNPDKEKFFDITQSSVRSRYMSNSHIFEKSVNNMEEILLDSTLNKQLEHVNMDLLELALKAHAFKSHHLNAHTEQVTILPKQRKVDFSCFYKIKALLRYHLQCLQFTNKEDLGFGLKYVFKKDVMHFCGTPEPRMEYETLVVQFLDEKGLIKREIYIFGAENKNCRKENVEQVQEQL